MIFKELDELIITPLLHVIQNHELCKTLFLYKLKKFFN